MDPPAPAPDPPGPGPSEASSHTIPPTLAGHPYFSNHGNHPKPVPTVSELSNGSFFTVTVHQIDIMVLLDMFKTMFLQLLKPNSHQFGFPNCTTAEAVTFLNNMAASLAWDAAAAASAVCYYKAARYDANPFLAQLASSLRLNSTSFPSYITTVINFIGPVWKHDGILPRVQVPIIDRADLDQNIPPTYRPDHSSLCMKLQNMKIRYAMVVIRVEISSAWWTVWPVKSPPAHSSGVNDGGNTRNLEEWTFFSYVQADEIEDCFKVAVILAGKPLITPGPTSSRATPWYEREALRDFTGTTPTVADFPPEGFEFPAWWVNTAASHPVVETKLSAFQDEDNDVAAQATEHGCSRSHGSFFNYLKPRKLTPTLKNDSNTHGNTHGGRTLRYRIKRRFFDHVFTREIEPLGEFAYQASKID